MEHKPHKQHTEMEQEHFCPTGSGAHQLPAAAGQQSLWLPQTPSLRDSQK